MKALMWALIVGATSLSLLIGCDPSPAPVAPLADLTMQFDETSFLHACDEQGICCYWKTGYANISCVATKVIVIVSPGEIKDESKGQRKPQIGGEVTSRALESRILYRLRSEYDSRTEGINR